MQYTLMSAQSVPTVPTGAAPPQVVIAGNPTRGRVTFSLTGKPTAFAKASLCAQTATTPYGYTEDIPLLVMTIVPNGPNHVSQDLPFNLAYNEFLFANLDIIGPSQQTFASMTLIV